MSCFDFGLQLLDPQAMTYWGRRRDANFWIENASVEWKESQAPFHTVARLTLLASSEWPPATCEAWHIDVTEHSTPDTKPLGSINRARWHAEMASRKARLGSSRSSLPHSSIPEISRELAALSANENVPRSLISRAPRRNSP